MYKRQAASLQGEGLGERRGMEWVLDKSVFDFSFFGKSVPVSYTHLYVLDTFRVRSWKIPLSE